MATIEPVLVESISIQALKSDLGGTESVVSTLDVKDHASGPFDLVELLVRYASATTPAAGLEGWVYKYSDGGASLEHAVQTIPFSFEELTPTTVDVDSSGTTLSVAATTIFSIGDIIIIDPDNGNSERQWNRVTGINAGVSLTVENTLSPNPTAANASEVNVWQGQVISLSSPVAYVDIALHNLDSDSGDDCTVEITATAQNGYLST